MHSIVISTAQQQLKQLKQLLEIAEETGLQTDITQLYAVLSDYSSLWLSLGRLYRRVGQQEQALQAVQEAASLAPTSLPIYLEVAIELRELGQYREALQMLDQLLERDPQHLQTLHHLGVLYLKQQAPEQAAAYFEKTLAIQPSYLESQIQLAVLFREAGAFERSQQQLQTALVHHPGEFRILLQLGLLERRRYRLHQALDWFQQAQDNADRPTQIQQAQLQIIEVLRDLNRLEDAGQAIDLLLAQYPEDIKIKMLQASVYQRQHKFVAAAEVYRSILHRDPSHLNARLALSRVFEELGQFEPALDLLKVNAMVAADALTLRLRTVEMLRCGHQLATATSQLQDLVAQYPQEGRISLQLGYVERQCGHRRQALAHFQRAQRLATEAGPAFNAQLLAIEELRDLGHLDEALDQLRQLLPQWSHHPRPKMLMASILRQQLKLSAAIDLYQEILQTDPHHPQAHLELATVLSETKQGTAAIEQLEHQCQSGVPSFAILMKLGQLIQAHEDWNQARHWFEMARQHYPPETPGISCPRRSALLSGRNGASFGIAHGGLVPAS